ncbi:MAG: hypothetical protein Sapg2KO_38770 [Saprospiraceae bacterium]
MISFFRKNRKVGMRNNNTRIYLFYALGEIILVVVGILIALQIDNWNQDRIERKEEIYILNSFLVDMEKDIQFLDDIISSTTERQKSVDSIFIILQNHKAYTLFDFLKHQEALTVDDYFAPNQGTFDESKASGKISFVENNALREEIFDYYRRISKKWNNDEANYKTTNDLIIPILIDEIGSSPEMVSAFSGFEATQLENLDLAQIAKNKNYYKALLYSTGDRYQIIEWTNTKNRAAKLKENLAQELMKLK